MTYRRLKTKERWCNYKIDALYAMVSRLFYKTSIRINRADINSTSLLIFLYCCIVFTLDSITISMILSLVILLFTVKYTVSGENDGSRKLG